MSAILRLPQLGLLNIFENLVASHPVGHFGALRTRSADRRAEEALTHMPPHLRDDAGLPPFPAHVPEHPALTEARRRGRNWG